jgi:hypothetical protein
VAYLKVLSQYLSGETEKYHGKSVMISGDWVDFKTEHPPPNTKRVTEHSVN